MTESFWKDAIASLPPAVQRRYARDFEMAQRLDDLLDLGFDAWGSAKRSVGRICQATAHAFLVAAWVFDSASRRLLPARG